MKTLNDMSCNEKGIIKRVGSSGSLRRRMIDMGITAGTKVTLIKHAPTGDPLEIRLHGYKLSIRKSEAKEIEICESDDQARQIRKKLGKKFFVSEINNQGTPKINNDNDFSTYKAALVGNPNSGKTTLFNRLTGSYQYVGNWPGVTVERKEGKIKNIGDSIELVDLPGVYSLSPYSPEEVITRNYIMNESPDVIINILDSTNLERNLYLTTQLLELDCRVILVLNMTDLVKSKVIDYKELEEKLGVPVIAVSAGKNKGIDKLLECISLYVKRGDFVRSSSSIYSERVENALKDIDEILKGKNNHHLHGRRFKTIKVFEGDCIVIKDYNLSKDEISKIEKIKNDICSDLGKEKDTIIPEERYTYIYDLCRRSIKNLAPKSKISFSEKMDKVLTGKYTAIPCFLILIFLIFYSTFGPFGVRLKDICENFINTHTHETISNILNYIGVSSWLKSLVLDAIIKGVGAVISFLPQIILLFTLLSLLEDCGYMARAAFIMDRPMRKIGLSGKAFVPLIMGFGCSVPAILGSKILESKKDKNLVIFLIPFMSCSAKMPLYLLFASTFFPSHQTLTVFSLYGFGVLCACFTAFLFKDSVFKGEESPFIMEIPDYKWPSLKNVRLSVWDKTKDFIERAGTVILVATVVVWFLQYFGPNFRPVSDNSGSILAKIGEFIAPIFRLCGFENWKASVSLITGLLAKESIVSTLSVLYSDGGNLEYMLSSNFSFASAISFLVFVLLYTPCIAAVSAIYKEYQDKKLAIFSVFYQFFIAYLMSSLVYQLIILFQRVFS